MKTAGTVQDETHQVLSAVFGDHWEPEGGERASGGRAGLRSYLLVPVRGRLRWIIPFDRASGGWVFTHWKPSTLPARIAWKTLALAYSLGLSGFVPGLRTITFSVDRDFDWREGLGWPNGQAPICSFMLGSPRKKTEEAAPTCSFLVGNPGVQRKVAVFPVGEEQAFPTSLTKVPLSPGAARSILREAEYVVEIARLRPGMVPELIWQGGENGDRAAYAMMHGRPAANKILHEHVVWLAALVQEGEVFDAGAALIEQRSRLEEYGDRLAELYPWADGSALVGRLLDRFSECRERLTAVIAHGDFGPWNLMVGDDESLRAFDWEDARLGWAPLFDLANAYWLGAYISDRDPGPEGPMSKSETESYLSMLKLPASAGPQLEAFYLAFTILETAAEGEADGYVGFLLDHAGIILG